MLYQIKEVLKPNRHLSTSNLPYNDIGGANQGENNILKEKSKFFYQKLIEQKSTLPKSTSKWQTEFNEDVNWNTIAKNKINKQCEIKIAEFNYKILNNILASNQNLFKWGKCPTSKCIYCDEINHDSKHLL